MAEVPVTGAVLRWAREFRELTEEDAADRLGLPIEDLRAYEAGERKPSLTVFENFAAKYRLPQATLFRRTPPKTRPEPTDFRTLEGRRPSFSFEFKVALSNVRSLLAMFAGVAEDDDEFVAPKLPRIDLNANPDDEGEKERRRLGISPEEQLSWTKPEAYRRWRSRIERQGVIVFQQKFALSDCRGFTLYESAEAPCIVVNKEDSSDSGKIFTLVHEYCHLLTRAPGISDQDNRNPTELFCNRFAAAFLMPRDLLRQLLPVWPNEPVQWTDAQISDWARRLKVSSMALAIRLEHLGVAPQGFGQRFRAIAAPRREGSGGNYVATRLSELGANYTRKVIEAFDRGVIDEVHAAEALGLATKHFEEARNMLSRYSDLAGV